MTVTSAEVAMRYHSNADVPCDITVFRAEATGELKESWEGSPRWVTLDEIEAQMLESQHPVLELMRKISEGGA